MSSVEVVMVVGLYGTAAIVEVNEDYVEDGKTRPMADVLHEFINDEDLRDCVPDEVFEKPGRYHANFYAKAALSHEGDFDVEEWFGDFRLESTRDYLSKEWKEEMIQDQGLEADDET